MVFDNYHEIPGDSALHAALEQAAQELPDGASLIVISREDPPAAFARIDAQDRLARIEWNNLKLTLEESTAIAAERFQLNAPKLRSLHEMSHGWAAGLTLALERMKRSGGELRHIQGEALESVFNYFAGQIFNTTEPEVREFLMRTALLQPITAAMAERISGKADAANLLENLYRRRLFTDRRGVPPFSFQYHDLFRAFLLDQLAHTYVPINLDELRRQAGAILEEAQRYDGAFAQYRSATDWDSAIRLTLARAQTLLAQGRSETLREWIKALPQELTAINPWLNYWHGVALLELGSDEARHPLEQAYQQLQKDRDAPGQIAFCSSIVMAYIRDGADCRPLDHCIDQMNGLLRTSPDFQSPLHELQVNAALASYAHLRNPRADFYESAINRSLRLLATDIPSTTRLVPRATWSGVYVKQVASRTALRSKPRCKRFCDRQP